jgi:hypothetical protein
MLHIKEGYIHREQHFQPSTDTSTSKLFGARKRSFTSSSVRLAEEGLCYATHARHLGIMDRNE